MARPSCFPMSFILSGPKMTRMTTIATISCIGLSKNASINSSPPFLAYLNALRQRADRIACTETCAEDRGVGGSGSGRQPQGRLRVSRPLAVGPGPEKGGDKGVAGSDRAGKFDLRRSGRPDPLLCEKQSALRAPCHHDHPDTACKKR